MRVRPRGQIRRSQAVTTWGPGSLIDLPTDSGIVGGLDTWPKPQDLDLIEEPRLTRKLQRMTGIVAPRLYAPPADTSVPWESKRGIGVWRFPEWYLVQEESTPDGGDGRSRSRRLVPRKALDERGRFETRTVVPTRFVRACPRGHVDDLDWRKFVHGPDDKCLGQLWLDEFGTSGDLGDLSVRCSCNKRRPLFEATDFASNPLGYCNGARPWLGRQAREECRQHSRLLIRTAANAYFSQVVSVLSLPDRGAEVQTVVQQHWDDLSIVSEVAELRLLKRKPRLAEALDPFDDQEILAAIEAMKRGAPDERKVKEVELEAILAAPEGYGDDVPIDPNFHARRLPDAAWRKSGRDWGIAAVIQLHRLREVMALTGFTRFEAVTPDIHGEYDTDVERAALALEPSWFPAVENRGEGIFVQLRVKAVIQWLARPGVRQRLDSLRSGHGRWQMERKSARDFPGGPYVLLHTLSHLLIQSLSMRCGYPASSIRERIYAEGDAGGYGILLYTGTPDADGTLGGLVQEARHMEDHLRTALQMASLCSNDPICAQHSPGQSMEARWLLGAACHGCTLIAETSCEMRNDYLDRALVEPVLSVPDAAFFGKDG